MGIEFRSLPLEFREASEEEAGHFAWLRVCNWDVPDSHNTSWDSSCFDKSLERKLPKLVYAHQSGMRGDKLNVIGKGVDWAKDSIGLDIRVKFSDFDDVPDARRMYSHLKNEEVDELSFGFSPVRSKPDPNYKDVTRFMQADMFEVSPVLVGSVPGTRVISVRSASGLYVPDYTQVRNTVMSQTPHTYKATTGDGSVCAVCGALPDHKSHTRTREIIELRDLAITLATDPSQADPGDDPNALIAACDAAVDAAIALASYQDLTGLPAWVAQMLALVMAADAAIDDAMELLGIPDADDTVSDGMARSLNLPEPKSVVLDPKQDPDFLALQARVVALSKRKI